MRKKLTYSVLLFLLALPFTGRAQVNDSAFCAKTFKELLSICKKPDHSDPKVMKFGEYYYAAPYIIYRGDNKSRAWKEFAIYTRIGDRELVDQICQKINTTVNQDSNYKILSYSTQTESEGTWHVLTVSYMNKKAGEKKLAFAFLKIANRMALGDIDAVAEEPTVQKQ